MLRLPNSCTCPQQLHLPPIAALGITQSNTPHPLYFRQKQFANSSFIPYVSCKIFKQKQAFEIYRGNGPTKMHMNMNPTKSGNKMRSRQFNQSEVAADSLKKQQPYKGILGSGKTSSKLKLAMWNVNGIRSVLSKYAMRDFIAKYNPDFICINETKINAQLYAKEKIKIKEYNDYWNFCKCSAGYSGVAIFTKYEPLSIFEDLEQPEYSQEGRVLTLEYQLFYLVVVYIPSAGDKTLKRLEYKVHKYEVAFQKYCEKLRQKGKGVIVCGDFNVSHEEIDIHVTPYTHKQPGFTPDQRISFKKFLNKGWIDTFRKLNPGLRKYTWWRIQHKNRDRGIGKRLDYFLVNEEFIKVVKKSLVLDDVMGSDHCPIFIEVDLSLLDKDQLADSIDKKKQTNQNSDKQQNGQTAQKEQNGEPTEEQNGEPTNEQNGEPTNEQNGELTKEQNEGTEHKYRQGGQKAQGQAEQHARQQAEAVQKEQQRRKKLSKPCDTREQTAAETKDNQYSLQQNNQDRLDR